MRFYNYLSIFSVDEYGNILKDNNKFVAEKNILLLPEMDGEEHKGQYAGEMEVFENMDGNSIEYWIALGSCYLENDQNTCYDHPEICLNWLNMNIIKTNMLFFFNCFQYEIHPRLHVEKQEWIIGSFWFGG